MTITTPAQMREAAARLAEKRAKYTMEAIKNATASALVSNIVTVTEAKVAHFIAAAIRALPVAEPEPLAVNAVMCAAERDAQSRDAVDLTLFRQAIRAEALEEAAKLPPYDGDGDPAGPFDHHVFVKRDAIRALMEKPE